MTKIRYIFGCKHENRTIFSYTTFERRLKIPIALCEDCVDTKKQFKDKENKKTEILILKKELFIF